jgi:hypothetical protein
MALVQRSVWPLDREQLSGSCKLMQATHTHTHTHPHRQNTTHTEGNRDKAAHIPRTHRSGGRGGVIAALQTRAMIGECGSRRRLKRSRVSAMSALLTSACQQSMSRMAETNSSTTAALAGSACCRAVACILTSPGNVTPAGAPVGVGGNDGCSGRGGCEVAAAAVTARPLPMSIAAKS